MDLVPKSGTETQQMAVVINEKLRSGVPESFRTALRMIRLYRKSSVKETGSLLKVGFEGKVLWSMYAYRADGEQLAGVLYLVGARPVWDSTASGVRGC